MVDKQESEIFASLIDAIISHTSTSSTTNDVGGASSSSSSSSSSTISLGASNRGGIIRQVNPTPEEMSLMRELEERRRVAQADAKRNKELRERNRREEELLRRARGELTVGGGFAF